MVWRVRWGEKFVYIYLLLEFQSTVEAHMAVRVLTYVGLLYQDILKARTRSEVGQLPPVLPIVLYNGAEHWDAAQALSPLIEPGPSALEMYRPQVRYLLIDEARYRDSELLQMRNLVAAVFRLEHSRTSSEIGQVLAALLEWLATPQQNSLRHAFTEWVRKVILARVPSAPVHEINDLAEMRTMVVNLEEEWKLEARRQGLQEGRLQGQQEGRLEGRHQGLLEGRQKGWQEGEATLLLRQLRKRFGELPDWVRIRVEQAPTERLEHWGERLLVVDSLATLFDDEFLMR